MKGNIKGRNKKGQVDFILLAIIMCLALFGFAMLFSASYPNAATIGVYGILLRQGAIFAFGIITFVFAASFDYHRYKRYSFVMVVVTIAVMALVLAVGFVSHGARRQISLGFISFQPSEFAKVVLVIYLAVRLSNPKTQNISTDKKNILKTFGMIGLFLATCVAQKHLSGTVMLALIGAMMMIVAGLPNKITAIAGSLAVIVGIPLVMLVGYRSDRITAFLAPFKHKQGIGWQIVQSLLAVGSGGMFGMGLGQSKQKYHYLPEAQNDYIYAVVCEELGFVGGVLVILLFVLLVWRGMCIALKAEDRLGMLMAFGVTSIIGLQMLINIGVVLSLLPSTGMQLPLFSSGGSSMIAVMWGLGILLNISKTSSVKKI